MEIESHRYGPGGAIDAWAEMLGPITAKGLGRDCILITEGLSGSLPAPFVARNWFTVVAANAAALAGDEILRSYLAAHQREEKSVGDFVSGVDRAADDAIQRYLKSATPGIPIVSEEKALECGLPSERYWLVDPLDGSSAFLFRAGKELPSVMIALMENGEPMVSVVYLPFVDRWFCAERNNGAYCIDLTGIDYQSRKIDTSTDGSRLTGAHVVMNQYGDAAYESQFFKDARDSLRAKGGAGLVTIEAPNSGIGCRMMAGDTEVVAVIHDNNPVKVKQDLWDIAPVKLFVEEAGGVVVNQRGEPYQLGSGEPIIMARNTRALADLLATLRI